MTPDPRSPQPARPWRQLARAFEWLLGPKAPLDELPAVEIGPMTAVPLRRLPELHVCDRCGADTVNPAFTDPVDELHWDMLLRCGTCGATRRLIVDNPTAERYDHDLDRGWRQIALSIERLEQQQMNDWASTFVTALDRDLIDAGDFCRHGVPGPRA